jgi:hypothetical protein
MTVRSAIGWLAILLSSMLTPSLAASAVGTTAPTFIVRFPLDRRMAVPLGGMHQTSWPQFGFDAAHTLFNPHETTIGPGNVAQLQEVWSFSTGVNNPAGNVVEADGVVYAASANGTLFALNASTGAQLWTFASGTGFSSSGSTAAVDRALVFTVCNVASGIQGICALRTTNGALKWSYAVPGMTTFAEAPPVISGGVLYFGGCGTIVTTSL